MAHECPDCGCQCHCGGDIDDLLLPSLSVARCFQIANANVRLARNDIAAVMKSWQPMATKQEILEWLQDGTFYIDDGKVYTSAGRELTQRINKRKRCEHGDPRVDLCYGGQRASVHVSHLIWMWNTNTVLPDGFEVHHRDADPTNNNWDNLIAVHPLDHAKLHAEAQQEVPF